LRHRPGWLGQDVLNTVRRVPRKPPPQPPVNGRPMTPRMLTTEEKLGEIRRLYFSTTRQSIDADLAKALDLLKSMNGEEERERATVYMEGLAQMRKDWKGKGKKFKS
jgi:hypothetical protein